LLAGLFAALVFGHMLYWATQHLGYAARYWFSALPALMALSALGCRRLVLAARRAPATGRLEARPLAARFAWIPLVALVTANFASYLPERLRELPSYGGIDAALKRAVEASALAGAVVFVETDGLLYNDGFYLNHPSLRGDPVFARDLGPRNAELLALYPTRRGFRWAGGVLTPMRESSRATPARAAAAEGSPK
jgi:hypothetical protein